jgi:chromosomal replication initiator protein
MHYAFAHDQYRQRAEASAWEPAALTSEAGRIWQEVLRGLVQDMPKASFETWVRDTVPVRYDGNTLTIAARNLYARDWLENRMTSTVQELLIGIVRQDVTVQFVVQERSM